jgi:hypothetical protein
MCYIKDLYGLIKKVMVKMLFSLLKKKKRVRKNYFIGKEGYQKPNAKFPGLRLDDFSSFRYRFGEKPKYLLLGR